MNHFVDVLILISDLLHTRADRADRLSTVIIEGTRDDLSSWLVPHQSNYVVERDTTCPRRSGRPPRACHVNFHNLRRYRSIVI